MKWLREHFEKYQQLRPWSFCWRISLEGTAMSLLIAGLLFPFAEERAITNLDIGAAFVILVLVAPVLETLLLQGLPVYVARKCRATAKTRIIAATAVFSALHFPEGFAAGMSAGLVGGFYFAFTYVHWRRTGRWVAYWTTMVSHAIHNGIAFVLLAIFGAWT